MYSKRIISFNPFDKLFNKGWIKANINSMILISMQGFTSQLCNMKRIKFELFDLNWY